MAKSAKNLLFGSVEAYSGKSAVIVGIAHQLKAKGIDIAYSKPLGTYVNTDQTNFQEEDVRFISQALNLKEGRVSPSLLYQDEYTLKHCLEEDDTTDYSASLEEYVQKLEGELLLLEGPANLWEGTLFNLSLAQIAERVEAKVLLVVRFQDHSLIDSVLSSGAQLGDHLLGVLINDIPHEKVAYTQEVIKPFLEQKGITVWGMLPRHNLLRSVSVRELAKQLGAKILCRKDRLDLMVESLTIGAMNVNSALEYFRKGQNMAVITGGDRSDLQLAALETSTNCLILTGNVAPQDFILTRAEDLEIPILSVDLDTLTAVEIADQAFGQVRFQEQIKVDCIQQLIGEYFELDKLIKELGIEPVAV